MTAAADRSDASALARVGPYVLGQRIGVGGTASVYRSTTRDGRDVAVKLLAPDLRANAAAAARFRREVRTLERLNHRNVISLVDHGEDPERGPYIVSPFLSGFTLRELLDTAPLLPDCALAVLESALEGLVALHDAGLVHRDLKPENLLLTTDGDVVLLDLGLALDPEVTRCTTEGSVAGSVPYMAPEIIDGAEPDARADVWALAVVAYELMSGRRPFQRERGSQEVASILAGSFDPLSDGDCRVDEQFDAWIAQCLAPRHDDRIADARAQRVALAPVLSRRDALARVSTRRRLATDRDALETSLRDEHVRRHLADARAALADGQRFRATRAIERARAYGASEAQIAPVLAGVGAQSLAAPRRRRRPWPVLAALAAVLAITVLAARLRRHRFSAPSPTIVARSVPRIAPATEPVAPSSPHDSPLPQSPLASPPPSRSTSLESHSAGVPIAHRRETRVTSAPRLERHRPPVATAPPERTTIPAPHGLITELP